MGYEYVIETEASDRERWTSLLERLAESPQYDGSFRAELIDSGVYFCEDARSAGSAIAFRKIIDEALSIRSSVVIREAE